MPHFRVDDALHSHPKTQRAGDDAIGMWVRAGSFCMAYLTDGFVPEWWVKQQPNGTRKAKKLVAAGLWHGGAERDGEKGYQFHEWLGPGRQDSREQILAEREKWRNKKQRQRTTASAMSPGDTSGDSPGGHSGGHSGGVPRGVPVSNTNPYKNSGYVPTGATDPNARATAATPGADLVREIVPKGHPPATLTSLRLQASELLNNGTDRADVAAALQLWCDKPNVGIGRTILASLVSEVIKARSAPTRGGVNGHRGSTADQRVAQVQALKSQSATGRLEIES